MSAESFMRPGAVDLSGLAAKSRPASAAGTGSGERGATSQTPPLEAEVLTRSLTVPPSSTVGRMVRAVQAAFADPGKAGARVRRQDLLAKPVDVDANPEPARHSRSSRSPPSLRSSRASRCRCSSAIPEPQVRQVIDQLLEVAATNGVSGRLRVAETSDEAEAKSQRPNHNMTRGSTRPPSRHREGRLRRGRGSLPVDAGRFSG